MKFRNIGELQTALKEQLYIADIGLATAIFLAIKLRRPLFLEGEAGVGKTEVAKVVAGLQDSPLIRLQCYEGLDVNQAVYEWNYSRQILHIRLMESQGDKASEKELFGPEFLLRRPLLQAIDYSGDRSPVLLIDEIDRSDEEFEAFLLELLSDFQITIPEIGTITSATPPTVVLTSNRTREVHDALKRRCLYYWIEYPTFEKELEIVKTKIPEAPAILSRQVTAFIQELRQLELYKKPGVAETLDWISALMVLDKRALAPQVVNDTLGVFLKYQDDVSLIHGEAVEALIRKSTEIA